MKRTFTMVLAMVLLVVLTAGATLAWLTDTDNTVTNTFTVGNVEITLAETTGDTYKMAPGETTEKDPTITVASTSEDCWVFVELVKEGNVDNYMTYAIADGWTALDDVDNVYYREGTASDSWSVLKDDEITMKDSVTGFGNDVPKLTFNAYAIQKAELTTPGAAWTALGK